jgi:beta-galactosidase
MAFKSLSFIFFLILNLISFAPASTLYTEDFTGNGDVSLVGWTGVYDDGGSNGGLADTFAWVWNNGICENMIYTNEYTIEISSSASIEFHYDLRKYSAYSSTPETSLAVQVGGNWYVSKTVFTTSSGSFITQSIIYDPAKENWDSLDVVTAGRGATAGANLAGNITGFGLYSDSSNLGSSCTAEYDNFTIIATEPIRTPDFNGSGIVDFQDFLDMAYAWISSEGQAHFNEKCDLDLDMDVNINDLVIFAQNWLAGAVYPYTPQVSSRRKLSFNTGWKFYRGTIPGDAAKDISYNDSAWQSVTVPHAPVITPLRVQWPGPGTEDINWYRKHFTVDSTDSEKKVFLEFEGADQVADLWVNGTYLTTHYGAYLPFTLDITDHISFDGSDNVIAVKVDESEDEDIPAYGLWLSSGGLYRDVWMHITDKLHVTDAVYADMVAGGGVFVTYPAVSAEQATVQIKTHIQNEHPLQKTCTVESFIVDVNDMVVAGAIDTQTIDASGNSTFTQTMTVISPELWHPDHPHLYTLFTHVYDGNEIADTCQTRIGIRKIAFSLAEGFTINGELLKFRGANRVQDYPYLGWAMGNLGQRRDVEKLREAGFNYIRTSHYPPDPSFLDACDEFGVVVMDEIPGFQYVGGDLFKSRSYQNMRDMIRRDRNHPCVIAWELSLNETNFDTTYAQTAMNIGHAEYPGDQCYIAAWMHDSIYDIYIATPTAGARSYSGSTPMIISEHGHWEYGGGSSTSDVHRAEDISADSYPGGEDPMLQQAWNHQESHHLNRGLSNICGDGLWVGIDYGAWPSGVYDFLRLPKFSAYFWQSQRNPDLDLSYLNVDSGPMVFIASHWTASSSTDVKVFSNCQQVKLYINDVLQDTRTADTNYPTANLLHPPFTFEGLTFQSGELKAEGLIDGQIVTSHRVRTPGSPELISVEFDITDVPANGSETIFVYASIHDSNGTIVPDASNEITFSVTDQAFLVTPATITAEAGIAAALIRVTNQPGSITVNATAAGLTSGSASIVSQ